MKCIAFAITILNLIAVLYLVGLAHQAQIESLEDERAAEVNALQAELDHFRATAAALSQRLSAQEQGQQLEKLGAQ